VGEINGLLTADDMAAWAQRVLPTKNTLQRDDATIVEKVFAAALERLTPDQEPGAENGRTAERAVEDGAVRSAGSPDAAKADPSPAAAKSSAEAVANATSNAECAELAFGKTRRKRDKDHRAFVASKGCLVCGRQPADAHHLRFAQPPALGRKVSDEFTVPLCRIHHRELHLRADEVAWWAQHPIDPLQVARELWERSHTKGASPAAGEGGQVASAPNPDVGRETSGPTAE
jgi:hypothetical protein